MREGNTDRERRIEKGDVSPEQELDVHRRSAKEPGVGPRDADNSRLCERRMTATMTPSTMPTIMASAVSSNVTDEPVEDLARS